jgi:hypothetical protein
MKKVGYEVTARRPVCVDFEDGRSISFRPGMRFKAIPSNPAVVRLLRVREIRKLAPYEPVPVPAIKLGLPHKQKAILQARQKIEQAKREAQAKMAASKAAPPKIEEAKPVPPKKIQPKDES